MPNPHLLFIGEYAGFEGGIERYAAGVAELLRRNGWTIDYAAEATGRNGDVFRQSFNNCFSLDEALKFNYDRIVVHKLRNPKILKKLIERFGENLAMICHDHDLYCPRRHYYTPLKNNCDRRFGWECMICSACCAHPPTPYKMWNFARYLHFARKIPNVAVLSEFMRKNLIANGFAPSKIDVVHPFTHAKEKQPFDGNDIPQFLFIGQIIRGKGVEFLLRAIPLLKSKVKIVIAGEGNQLEYAKKLAEKLKVTNVATFVGWVDSPEKLMAKSRAVVSPFFWQEPFGLIGIEAASCGVPMIAFDVGGVREYLNASTGIIVPYKNIAALAEAIDDLATDEKLAKRLGTGAYEQAVSVFSPSRFVESFTQFLRL